LTLRKELLIAESEINRVQLIDEWRDLTDWPRAVGAQMWSVSSLVSAAVQFVSRLGASRRPADSQNGAKPSWFQTALNGARLVSSAWSQFFT
jgi:hypothetical protein